MNIKSKKGTWCPYKPCLFCQEGYCQDCMISLARTRDIKKRLLELKLAFPGHL